MNAPASAAPLLETPLPSLKKLGDLLGNECFQNGLYKHSDEYGTGAPIIRINNFDNSGQLLTQSFNRVSVSAEEHQKFSIRELDILINRVNSLSHVGKSLLVPSMIEYPVYESNMMRIRVGADSLLAPEYVAVVLQNEAARKHLRKVAKPAVAQVSVNQDDVRSISIVLHPKPIQKRIAKISSAWDTIIDKTEQLVASKEQYFRALVRLLIVKRETSEKSGRRARICDISERVQRRADGKDHPLLTISSASGFVRQEDKYRRHMAGESAKTYTLLRAGEFSYNKGNSLRYEFGCIFQLERYEAALVPSVYVSFRLHDSVCASYMRHLFAVDYLKPQLRALVKTGVRNNGLLNIRPDEFMGTMVPLPPREEQQRIASALDAAQLEIKLLKEQLALLRRQKRGLMQKLLTGQWRLKFPETETV